MEYSHCFCDFSAPLDGPHNVTVTELEASSITISWKPPETPNGIITHYNINASFTDSANSDRDHLVTRVVLTDNEELAIADDGYLLYEINELHGVCTYDVALVACNNAGCSPVSNAVHATTLVGGRKVS